MINYQPQPYNPSFDFQALPEGHYRVSIDEITERISGDQSKYPGVKYIVFKMIVAEGAYSGRLLFENVNLNNPKEKVKMIARQTLDGIAYGLEVTSFNNQAFLLHKPFQVKVVIKNGRNNITKYYKTSDVLTDDKKNPTINHKVKGAPQPNAALPMSDEDVPF